MAITRTKEYTQEHILNQSFDKETQLLMVQGLEYDPSGQVIREVTKSLALRVDDTTTTNVTYLGEATPASTTSSAVWRIKKIDETTGAVITWADGNSEFDNIWDNRSSLTYA